MVAAFQWCPFESCTRNYAYVAPQIRPFCKRKRKKHPQKRLIKFSVWGLKGKQFYQPTLVPISLHFRGMTTLQTNIIIYRNKHLEIAVLIFPYHEKLRKGTNLQIKVSELLQIASEHLTRVTLIYVYFRRNM